jgi:hypothetical protein
MPVFRVGQFWSAFLSQLYVGVNTLRDPPPRERIAEVITALVHQADTISTLARHLGLSRRSILDYQRGEQLLQLDTLVRKVSIALRQIVIGNSGTNPSATALAGIGQG